MKYVPIKIVIGAFGNGKPEDCVGIIEKVDDTDNGIFTKYVGCNYLFKGFPDVRIVETISIPKKMISKAIPDKPVKFFLLGVLGLYSVFPKKKQIADFFINYFLEIATLTMTFNETLRKGVILPKEKYCKSGKEIYRAMEVIGIRKKLKEVIAMTWEYDYAYRLRGQDLIPFLNKEALRKNPVKEIKRLIDILIERDISCKDKWKSLKKWIILLRIKKIRKIIVDLLLEIDLEKIKMDEADWYFSLDRNDYNYGGLPYKERMEISKELDKKVGNKRRKIEFEKVDKKTITQ